MARAYISTELRRAVAQRADHICEYCLIRAVDRASGCQVDHIISVKHGGDTALENLAYACAYCNVHKGSDLGSIVWQTGDLARFFNPRRDRWSQHFQLEAAQLLPLTEIGEVTERIFQFNHSERVFERDLFIQAGVYPSAAAQQRMAFATDGEPR